MVSPVATVEAHAAAVGHDGRIGASSVAFVAPVVTGARPRATAPAMPVSPVGLGPFYGVVIPVSLCATVSTRNVGVITSRADRPPTSAAIAMVTAHRGRASAHAVATAVVLVGLTRATVFPILGLVSVSRVIFLGTV